MSALLGCSNADLTALNFHVMYQLASSSERATSERVRVRERGQKEERAGFARETTPDENAEAYKSKTRG